MILIGQYDSPFTRRVGITLDAYGIVFEHRPWSVFGDAERLAEVNPLIRVPTLVLDSGEALVETSSIIDYLDARVLPGQRLFPQDQPARYQAMKVVGMASGISDKAVSLFYEQQLHATPSADYVGRLSRQITGALSWLEKARSGTPGNYWFEGRVTQADIAVTCTLRHLIEAHPTLFEPQDYPALSADREKFEARDVFQRISQPFVPPA